MRNTKQRLLNTETDTTWLIFLFWADHVGARRKKTTIKVKFTLLDNEKNCVNWSQKFSNDQQITKISRFFRKKIVVVYKIKIRRNSPSNINKYAQYYVSVIFIIQASLAQVLKFSAALNVGAFIINESLMRIAPENEVSCITNHEQQTARDVINIKCPRKSDFFSFAFLIQSSNLMNVLKYYHLLNWHWLAFFHFYQFPVFILFFPFRNHIRNFKLSSGEANNFERWHKKLFRFCSLFFFRVTQIPFNVYLLFIATRWTELRKKKWSTTNNDDRGNGKTSETRLRTTKSKRRLVVSRKTFSPTLSWLMYTFNVASGERMCDEKWSLSVYYRENSREIKLWSLLNEIAEKNIAKSCRLK